MGIKKRELTVEVWSRKNVSLARHLLSNMPEAFNLIDSRSIGEVLMAKSFLDCGMQVYDFDKDFTESILNEKWVDILPDVIDYAPHDCFYMKLPFNDTSEGCVVCISQLCDVLNIDEYDIGYVEKGPGVYKHPTCGFGAIVNTGEKIVFVQGFAIPKRFEMMLDDSELGLYPDALLMNAFAYICSANADIVPVYSPPSGLRKNKSKKRSDATWHEVGYRIGAELRSYAKERDSDIGEKTGRTVRPHMRRAHWHHFWTGPKNGERRLVLKWIAPTMVGVGIESATVHRVGHGD